MRLASNSLLNQLAKSFGVSRATLREALRAVMLCFGYAEADETDTRRFQLERNEKILLLKRIRTADNEHVIYCIDKIPERYLPDNFTYNQRSLFDDLKMHTSLEIQYANSEISALASDPEISSF